MEWNPALFPALKKSLIASAVGNSAKTKCSNAIATIVAWEIFRKASEEIHSSGYNEIPIESKKFNASEVLVLRALCENGHYAFKVID